MATPDWLQQLRTEYAASLSLRLHALEGLVARLPSSRDDLIRELHKLGGSAATYGFEHLGQAARRWERALTAGAEPGALVRDLREAARITPAPEAGEQTPALEPGEKTPAPEAGQKTPAPEAGERTPAPETSEPQE